MSLIVTRTEFYGIHYANFPLKKKQIEVHVACVRQIV